MTKQITYGIGLSLALLAGCDHAQPNPEPTTFRRGDDNCPPLQRYRGSTFKLGVMPFDPYGGGPDGPFTEMVYANIQNNAFAVLAGEVEHLEGAAESCNALCDEAGLSWGGQGCIVDAGIAIDEVEPIETEFGEMLQFQVDAEAELGCSCE